MQERKQQALQTAKSTRLYRKFLMPSIRRRTVPPKVSVPKDGLTACLKDLHVVPFEEAEDLTGAKYLQ